MILQFQKSFILLLTFDSAAFGIKIKKCPLIFLAKIYITRQKLNAGFWETGY